MHKHLEVDRIQERRTSLIKQNLNDTKKQPKMSQKDKVAKKKKKKSLNKVQTKAKYKSMKTQETRITLEEAWLKHGGSTERQEGAHWKEGNHTNDT